MKKIQMFAIFMVVLGILFVNPAFSQYGTVPQNGTVPPNLNGMNKGGNRMKMYDVNTVETLNGVILAINKTPSKNEMNAGIILSFKTDKETINVRLGPSWFIDKQDVKLNVNDNITVKGSRINFGNKSVIIAAVITKDGKTMELRNDNGTPLWSKQNK